MYPKEHPVVFNFGDDEEEHPTDPSSSPLGAYVPELGGGYTDGRAHFQAIHAHIPHSTLAVAVAVAAAIVYDLSMYVTMRFFFMPTILGMKSN